MKREIRLAAEGPQQTVVRLVYVYVPSDMKAGIEAGQQRWRDRLGQADNRL